MPILIAFGAATICHWLMIAAVVHQQRKNTLSSHRFALIVAGGLTSSVWSLFFIGGILGGTGPIRMEFVGIGLGIGVLMFLSAYPVFYYFHKYILIHVFDYIAKRK